MVHELRAMYGALQQADKRNLYYLLYVSGAYALLDFANSAVLMPFLTFLMAPAKLTGTIGNIFTAFANLGTGTVLLIYGAIIVGLQLIRMVSAVWLTRRLNAFSYERFNEVACATFVNFLGHSYEEYAATNPAILWRLLAQDGMQYATIYYSVMQIFIELCAILCIYALLLWVSFKLTLALTGLVAVLLLLTRPLNKLASSAGSLMTGSWEEFNRVLNETYGNFKILRLVGGEQQAMKRFAHATNGVKNSLVSLMTLQAIPRVAFEGFVVILFVVITGYISYYYHGIDVTSPLFSMYAIAAYRFMPAINRMLYNYQQLTYSLGAVRKGVDQLLHHIAEKQGQKKQELYMRLPFNKVLSCNELTFVFAGQKHATLNKLSLEINKGERVAFVGKSGAGKSTLIDLMIGLQRPTGGTICLDGVPLTSELLPHWWRMIGYIPQQIYLVDGTVRDNVVLGRPYDEAELIACLEKAKALEFLRSKDGLDTRVGEGGFQISGGQKQRIALARALYGNPALLILDEGTAALDQETEEQVLEEILHLPGDTTILMVTHRPAILEQCDKVYTVQDGIALETSIRPPLGTQTQQTLG